MHLLPHVRADLGRSFSPLSTQARTPMWPTEIWIVPREPGPRGDLMLRDVAPGLPEDGR